MEVLNFYGFHIWMVFKNVIFNVREIRLFVITLKWKILYIHYEICEAVHNQFVKYKFGG